MSSVGCTAQGSGVGWGQVRAVRWLRWAAERKNAAAQAYLGVMYFVNDGVEKNHAETVRWTRRAAAQRLEQGRPFLTREMC